MRLEVAVPSQVPPRPPTIAPRSSSAPTYRFGTRWTAWNASVLSEYPFARENKPSFYPERSYWKRRDKMRVDFALLLHATAEHIELTAIAVGIAVAIGVPLGAYLNRERFLAGPVLALVGVIQTVPSLALLGLLIPLLGIGEKPALLALFLYALLPI